MINNLCFQKTERKKKKSFAWTTKAKMTKREKTFIPPLCIRTWYTSQGRRKRVFFLSLLFWPAKKQQMEKNPPFAMKGNQKEKLESWINRKPLNYSGNNFGKKSLNAFFSLLFLLFPLKKIQHFSNFFWRERVWGKNWIFGSKFDSTLFESEP